MNAYLSATSLPFELTALGYMEDRGQWIAFITSYGVPKLPADAKRLQYNQRLLKQPPMKLHAWARARVTDAISETCKIRKWDLWALSVQSNHIHSVVTANCKPKKILNAFKANATRELRTAGYCHPELSPWAENGSKRYLWTEEDLRKVIAYVLYEQGELPE